MKEKHHEIVNTQETTAVPQGYVAANVSVIWLCFHRDVVDEAMYDLVTLERGHF